MPKASQSRTSQSRTSQRQPLSCMNCARRKLRCSKVIPCSSCLDRGEGDSCCREIVHVTKSQKTRRTTSQTRQSTRPALDQQHTPPTSNTSYPTIVGPESTLDLTTTSNEGTPSEHMIFQNLEIETTNNDIHVPHLEQHTHSHTGKSPSIPGIQNQAVVTLEFLTHGRQNILRIANTTDRIGVGPQYSPFATNVLSPDSSYIEAACLLPWNDVLSIEQCRKLLTIHEKHMAWMHSVVHMPTFRQGFNAFLANSQWNLGWVALLYALLCSTIYHSDDQMLEEVYLQPTVALTQRLYNRCVQCLNESNFMATPRLDSVQTICVLLQVAHNLDQSDYISVLLAAGIKICQLLGCHRLGLDSVELKAIEGLSIKEMLIEREVKKRVWWFMIRQDWLQIPFQNTYLVHASQFNTPLPLNCDDNPDEMFEDDQVVVRPDSHLTVNSYLSYINKISIIIWKHQDRMCSTGHPGNSREGILKLYDQVLWADNALKEKFLELPSYLRKPGTSPPHHPPYAHYLGSVLLLSLAHKVLTVHRHFQLPSFRDKAFAYTQQSCLAISQRSIRELEAWPSNSITRMMLRTWTVITHIITSSVNLTFASIFREQNILLYDGVETQRLAKVGRELIRLVEDWSSIARRGGCLLDELFDLEESFRSSSDVEFRIENIIRKVSQLDDSFQGELGLDFDTFGSIGEWGFEKFTTT